MREPYGNVQLCEMSLPQSASLTAPSQREPVLYKMQRNLRPEGVNVEGDGKALRKMQHSCIF